MFKKTILIDLDGVLNTYVGKYDKNIIPPLRQGAFDFLKKLSSDFRILLFTSRDSSLAKKWIKDNKLNHYIEDVTNIKEPSYLMVDDRCLTFRGDYDDIKKEIDSFKPWYKQ